MKIVRAAFLSTATLIGSTHAMNLRSLFKHADKLADQKSAASKAEADDAERAAVIADLTADTPQDNHRSLQNSNCENADGSPKQAWHPNYQYPWETSYCTFRTDCDTIAYTSEVNCCNAAYGNQPSGVCYSKLDNPPTTSPTETGGLDVWYPDYSISDWTDGFCKNERPLPNGWPTYSSELACCKAAYGGQMTGKCLSELESPPTTSPTNSDYEVDFFYSVSEVPWSESGCSNKLPLTFNRGDRPEYATHLECCKMAYGGQTSGMCISQLESPPTTSPTNSDYEVDFFYPVYEVPFPESGCSNKLPLPYNKGDRPEYDTHLKCCQGAYGGQVSGVCVSQLENPPTTSPTNSDYEADFFYSVSEVEWADSGCSNKLPLTFNRGDRPEYATHAACCKGAYAGQTSGVCLSQLESPPTVSPTESAGVVAVLWHRDSASGTCSTTTGNTNEKGEDTAEECCDAYFSSFGTSSTAFLGCQCAANDCYSCGCPGATNAKCPLLTETCD